MSKLRKIEGKNGKNLFPIALSGIQIHCCSKYTQFDAVLNHVRRS
jgi:hypothetical protein